MVGAFTDCLNVCHLKSTRTPKSSHSLEWKADTATHFLLREEQAAVRAEVWHWATGDQLPFPQQWPPKPLQDSWGRPVVGTRGWHLLCSGIQNSISNLISCIRAGIKLCVHEYVSVCSFRSLSFTEVSRLLTHASLLKEKSSFTKTLLSRAVPLWKLVNFYLFHSVTVLLMRPGWYKYTVCAKVMKARNNCR